jgi:hypothetical protein
MLAHHWLFPKLCVTVALVLFTTSSLAVAAHSSDGSRPLDAGGRLAPIGKLYSLGAVMIDGRTLSGEQSLWGGEQIWAKEASANIHLDGAGQVLLYKGSIARLATSTPARGAIEIESALSVFVSTGEIAVSLEPDFIAHITIGDDVFRASRGAKFKARTAGDESTFEMSLGEISIEALSSQIKYKIIRVKRNNSRVWVDSHQKRIDVQPNEPTLIPVRVTPQPRKTTTMISKTSVALVGYQVGLTNQPLDGIEVEFCLADTTIGSIDPGGSRCRTVPTDSAGVASVVFTAGPNEGTSDITAKVVLSNDSWTGTIVVKKAPPPHRLRNLLIVAAVAGGLGGLICVFKCGHDGGPLRQVPPPVIP